MANSSTSCVASSTNTITTSVVVSLPGSLIPTNTISLSSANVSATGISLTSTTNTFPSTAGHIHASAKASSSCVTTQNSSLNAGMSTAVSSVTGISSSFIVPSTATLLSLRHNTSSISSTSVSNLTANNASSVIVATSVTSIPSCSSLTATPKTATITTSTSLFPGIAVSSISGACSTTSVLLPLAGSIVPSTTNSAVSTFSTSIITPSSTSNTCSTSSKYDTKDDHVEYARSCRAIIDLGGDILRYLLNRHILPVDLPQKVNKNSTLLYRLNQQQINLIHNTPIVGYRELDISLLFSLIRNLCPSLVPTCGWKSNIMPTSSEVKLGDDVQRIRILRNEDYGHVSDTSDAGRRSHVVWTELGDVCKRLDNAFPTTFSADLQRIQMTIMDSKTKKHDDAKISSLKRKNEILENEVDTEKKKTKKVTRKKKKKSHKINSLSRGRTATERHRNKLLVEREELEESCLNSLMENFILLVTGNTGSGKSTLCLEIIQQLSKAEGPFDLYILEEPEEWLGINFSSENDVVVLMDDFCDENVSLSNKFENWEQHLANIRDCVQQGKAYVVIAVESKRLSEIQMLLHDDCPIKQSTRFDLTNDWHLNLEEKKKYFWQMYEACTGSFKNNLNESEVFEMCNCKPQMSFFQVCQCFFEHQVNFEMGLKYFKQAEIDYSSLIEDLYSKDFIQFAVIFCSLILGKFDFDENTMTTLGNVCSGFRQNCPSEDALKRAIHCLKESGLLEDFHRDGIYKVSNISKTLPCVAGYNISIFLEIGGKKVLSYLRPQSYKPRPEEACICIQFKHYSSLADILENEFSLDAIKSDHLIDKCLSHPACSEKAFLVLLLSRMKANWPIEKKNDYFVPILYWACFKGNEFLVKEVLCSLEDDVVTSEIFNKALIQVSYCENNFENVINILIQSDYINLMKVENIMPLVKNKLLRPNVLRKIIYKVQFKDENEIRKLILKVLVAPNIVSPLKKTILILSSRLTKSYLISLTNDIVERNLHNEQFISRSLAQATRSLHSEEKNATFSSILETLLESHIDLSTYLSFIHEWEKSKEFSNLDSGDVFRFLFIKPLEKPWNEEYLVDDVIRRQTVRLDKKQMLATIKTCFQRNCTGCIEVIVQSSCKTFNKTDIWRLLLELTDMCTSEGIKYFFQKALTLEFVKDAFEMCHVRVLNNILASNAQAWLTHSLFHFVLTLSLCMNITSEGVPYLCQMIKSYNSFSSFDFLKYLFSVHWGAEMPWRYSEQLAHCIVHEEMNLKETFSEYTKLHMKKRIPFPLSIYYCILQVCALNRNISMQEMNELPAHDIDTLIWKILSFCYRGIVKEKESIKYLFDLLLLHQHQLSMNTLSLVGTIALDRNFSDSSDISFQWIGPFIDLQPQVEHGVIQYLLMKMIHSKKLARSKSDDVKKMLDKTVGTSGALLSSNSLFKILHYACRSEFEDNNLLSVLIRNSNTLILEPFKLTHILRKVNKHKSYSVLNALYDVGVLNQICTVMKSKPFVDLKRNTFLMLCKDPLSSETRKDSMLRNFLMLTNSEGEKYSIDLLAKIVSGVSELGDFEVNFIVDYITCASISSRMKDIAEYDVSLIYKSMIEKSKGRIRISQYKMETFFEVCHFSFVVQAQELLRVNWFSLDVDILCTIFKRVYDSNRFDADVENLMDRLSNTTYQCTIRDSRAIGKLWFCSNLTDFLSVFLKSTVFPSLDMDGISVALDQCFFVPTGNITNAFLEYMEHSHNGVCVSALIKLFKRFYIETDSIFNLETPIKSSAEVVFINHLHQNRVKDSFKVIYLDLEFEISQFLIEVLLMLFLFQLKRDNSYNSTFVFTVPIRHEGILSRGSLVYIVRNRNNSVCTVKMICKNSQEIFVEATFHPDGVSACLCLDNFTSPTQYMMSLISAVMCFGLKHHFDDVHTIMCMVYDNWSYFKDRRISLPIGGYIINIKLIDMFLIYTCHSLISKNTEIKDSLLRRIHFLELTPNVNCRNLDDTSKRTLLGSFNSIEHLLRQFSSRDNEEGFYLLSYINDDVELDEIDSSDIVLPFCYYIMSFVPNEQDKLLILIYLIQQFDFLLSIMFIYKQLTLNLDSNVVMALRHIIFCDHNIISSLMDLLSSQHCFLLEKNSPKDRKNVLEGVADIWDTAKKNLEYRTNFLKIMSLLCLTNLVRSEIRSDNQLLSARYILKYIEISFHTKDKMEMFELIIQHRNITSGVMRKSLLFLIKSLNENTKFDDNEVLGIFATRAFRLNAKDLMCITHELKENCLSVRFQHIEEEIITQAFEGMDSSLINDIALDYFMLHGESDPELKVISVDIRKLNNKVMISHLLKSVKVVQGNQTIQGNIPNECHRYTFELGFSHVEGVLFKITWNKDDFGKRQYILSSMLSKDITEYEVMELLSSTLSLGHYYIELVFFLLDSIPFTLSADNWTHIITTVIQLYLRRVSDASILSELDQAEPDVRGVERFLNTKHGKILIRQEQLGKLVQTTIQSYINSSEIMSLLFCHYNTIRITDRAAISLSKNAITVPYVRSVEYIEMFLKEADVTRVNNGDIKRLIDACLRSPCDQSRSLDVILSHCPDSAVRINVLNETLMESVKMGNHSTLRCFLANHKLLQKDTVFISLVNHATALFKGKSVDSNNDIMISIEKWSSSDMVFVKLLHLYLLHHNYDCVYRIQMKKSQGQDIDNRTYGISLEYDYQTVLTMQFMFSSLFSNTDTDIIEVTVNIDPSKNLTSPMIVNMSLRAIANEEIMDPLVSILYEIADSVKLSDDELQILFCAMINRKYAGREDYIHSLLSSPMYCGISEKSATGILRTATCKQRNNTAIIDLFIEEADRCDVLLSEPNIKLLISDLCECRHERTVVYLRKLLPSPITPDGLSDDVFIAALTSYLRVKGECSKIVSFLKEYKTDVSDNFRCLLEKLKSDTQQKSDSDDEDDEGEDDDDSIKSYKKGEIERKTIIIDDIITSYFSMETE